MLSSDDLTLSSTLRQLNQFGYNVDRLQFVAKDEVELLDRFQQDYNRFTNVVTNVLELIRAGRAAEARELQVAQAAPLADRLERLTNQLVNKAEADMVTGIEASNQAYVTSQWTVVGFALGSSVLALILGYAISGSLIGPVTEVEARLSQIAAGVPRRPCYNWPGSPAILEPTPDRCAISIRSPPTRPPSSRCSAWSNRYVGNLPPMPGVFPDYKAPIVRNGAEGRELAMARWGMPSSSKALMEATRSAPPS